MKRVGKDPEILLLTFIAGLGCLFYSIACVTDINHPPGLRLIRLGSLIVLTGLFLLEVYRPWSGLIAFILCFPQMCVVRELLAICLSPIFGNLPSFWAAPAAAALLLAILWRGRHQEESAMDGAEPGRVCASATNWARRLLWVFVATWVISLACCAPRLYSPPSGWIVLPAHFRLLIIQGPHSAIYPLLLTIQILPCIGIGIVLLRMAAQNVQIPIERIVNACLISGALIAVEVLVQTLFDLPWRYNYQGDPRGGPFENPNTTVVFLTVTTIMSVTLYFRNTVKWRVVACGAFALALAATLATASRNGIFIILVLSIVAPLWNGSYLKPILAAAVLCVAAAVMLVLPLPRESEVSFLPARRLVGTLEAIRHRDWETLTTSRLELYGIALDMSDEFRYTGAGPGSFAMLGFYGAKYNHLTTDALTAHSMPMNLLAEIGPFGALAWLAVFIFLPLFVYWKGRGSRFLVLAALAVGLANLFDTVLLNPGAAVWLTTVFALGFCPELAARSVSAQIREHTKLEMAQGR